MIPSLTSGAISWVGHVGLGQGPSGAGQMPAWPPSAHCTGWWWGWSPQGNLLPDACYFPSEKVTHFPAAVNGPHHRCSVARHSPMGMPCASPENNAQSTLWEKVPFPGSMWQGLPVGTREGLGQAQVWQAEWTLGEDAVYVRRCVCGDAHLPREGWDAAGIPGCGEQLCAHAGTALWGPASSFGEVDTGSFLM